MAREGRQHTFASFAQPNYRLYFFGALISNVGTWVQRVGQDWLVLTHLTDHSSAALGIVTALQFLAIPFLAPYAGTVVDRVPKRLMLIITQVMLGLNATALWALVATGRAELWHVYLFALVQGITTAFDNPARQAFVSEMVPTHLVANAVGLNSMSFNAARLVGPGAAGLLIAAVGVGPTLLINAFSFLAMIGVLALMRPELLTPATPSRERGRVRDGVLYIAGRPDIVLLLVVVFMLGTFGMNFQVFNATMATTVFHQGAEEYGLLGTVMAVGTLGGALMAARRIRPRFRTVMVSLAGFSVSTFLLAIAPSYPFYAAMLIPAGFCSLSVMTTANASVQLSTAPEFRGRVMAVYMAIFMGGTPLGAPLIGWIGERFGARMSVMVAPLATSLTVIGIVVWLMRHRHLRFRLERRWPLVSTRLLPLEAAATEASSTEGA